MSHSAQKIRGKDFGVPEDSRYRKTSCLRRGYHYLPLNFFRLTVPNKLVGEPVCFSEKICYRKFSCVANCGHHGFVEKILSQSAEGLCLGRPLCFRKILVSKKFLCVGGGITVLSKSFRLTGKKTKNIVNEPFCVSEFFCYGKKLWISGGGGGIGITLFRPNFFVPRPTVPRNFGGNISVFQKTPGIEHFYV